MKEALKQEAEKAGLRTDEQGDTKKMTRDELRQSIIDKIKNIDKKGLC